MKFGPEVSLQPTNHEERLALFGHFTWHNTPTDENPERVRIDREWVRKHLVEVHVPEIHSIGGPKSVTVHYRVAESFKELWQLWAAAGVLPETINGTWAQRFKRGTGTKAERRRRAELSGPAGLSNHAWGTAVDVNAQVWPLCRDWNLVQADGPAVFERARLANTIGWAWGGIWKRADAMHFEATKAAVRPYKGA